MALLSPFPTMFSKGFFVMVVLKLGLYNKEINAFLTEHGTNITYLWMSAILSYVLIHCIGT